MQTVIERHGRIDVRINNAGMGYAPSLEQADEDDIQKILDINYMGVVRCTKAVLPHMRQARAGHVINISSVGGLVGQPFNEIYCVAFQRRVTGCLERTWCTACSNRLLSC